MTRIPFFVAISLTFGAAAAADPVIKIGGIKCMALVTHFYASEVLVPELRLTLDGYVGGMGAAGIDQTEFRDAFVKACTRQPQLSIGSATGAALQGIRSQ